MESRVKILGHPAHPMFIVFPLGLLATAVIFDLIGMATADSSWVSMAYYLIGAGLIGGIIAAVFGVLDWTKIPSQTRAWRIGAVHGIGNLVVVVLFACSFFLRRESPSTPPPFAYVCSLSGFLLAAVTGWLGGELVTRLGVSVDDDAGLNAPNALERGAHPPGTPQPRSL